MQKDIPNSLNAAKRVCSVEHLCWVNASSLLLFEPDFREAFYVEGVVASTATPLPIEHAWVVFRDAIIDPTLPDMELNYFPAFRWSYDEFLPLHFAENELPLFRRTQFARNAVQVEMDSARQEAREWLETAASQANSQGLG